LFVLWVVFSASKLQKQNDKQVEILAPTVVQIHRW